MDQISWPGSLFFSFHTMLILLSFLWLASAAATIPASCHADQRSALLQIKEGFINSNLTSWQPDTDCCNGWEGVSCDKSSGYVTDLDLSNYGIEGNLSVAIFNLTSLQYLNLAYNNFSQNNIPDGFEKLTKLTHLNLSVSNFTGQIPIGIANLTNLISLDLSDYWNNMRLHKPNFRTLVSNLSKLRELYLDCVNISENGKEWCWALSDSVPQLQILSMSDCNLSGPIEASLSQLHSLAVIHLSYNSFYSSVPDYFVDFPLKDLQLNQCDLKGFFPLKIFQILTLTILDISQNKDLLVSSPEFPLGSSLEIMILYGTNLFGHISDSIGNLQNLAHLDLNFCNLSGQIPSSTGKLAKLEYLDLSYNSFSSTIPPSLFSLPNLETLHLVKTKLSGEFRMEDESSVLFSPLIDLDLSINQLTGSISRAIYKFSNLEVLELAGNQFSGPIPISIFGLTSLQTINLAVNNFSGTFKLSLLQHLPNLTNLYLSHNQLSLEDVSDEDLLLSFPRISSFALASCNLSQIPRLLRYHNGLMDVDLSNNHIQGVVPKWIWEKFLINPFGNNLDLSANRLTGEIPSSICEAGLFYLDLSTNNLSGFIPSCLFEQPKLQFLILAENKFQGRLHGNIQKSCQLLVLDLSYNDLYGKLPKSLMWCTNLMILDMENNHIADAFPFWLGNIPNLQILILKSNQLYGTLEPPSKLASKISLFKNLRILDLALNNFHGSLPPLLFQNLKSMVNLSLYEVTSDTFDNNKFLYSYFTTENGILITNKGTQMKLKFLLSSLMVEIDLSKNRFSGEIPEAIGTLSELRVLNLSHNVFTRSIPHSLKALDHIESLDLSWNNLSGEIPQELTSLDSLSTLNLSFNHLVGRIPQSPHFSTFDNSSFEGNSGLCGVPLSKQCEATSQGDTSISPSTSYSKEKSAIVLLYFFIGLGFGTGFAVAIFYPVIKRVISIYGSFIKIPCGQTQFLS